MKSKFDMLRVAKVKGEFPKIDPVFKIQGRGCYVCKTLDCVSKAKKNKLIERSLRSSLPVDLYDSMCDMLNVLNY